MTAITLRSLPGRTTHAGTANAPTHADDNEPSLRGTVIAGTLAIASCFGGFLGWSLLAHLDSAIIAAGTVIVDSHRKTIQHLEGGILSQMLVHEGDRVRMGQPVALLDATQSQAQLSQLLAQTLATHAELARLRAEQAGLREMEDPPELAGTANDPHAAALLAGQRRLFQVRWQAHDSAKAVLEQRIEQSRKEIAGAEAELAATNERLRLYEEELAGVVYLLNKGYERRPRMLELKRTVAELKGRQGELTNQIGRANAAIAGTTQEIANLEQTRLAEIARDIADAQTIEKDLSERVRAARDVRERRSVAAPQDGIVVDLRVVTPGGVIGPGQALMDIVPVDDEMIVEARVSPIDIERLHPGLPAEARLSAYKRSNAPVIAGVVSYVSADKLADPRTGEPYFTVRLKLLAESLAMNEGAHLSPGMPVEVMINTGDRRAIDYFVEPLTERMRHALRER